MLAVIVQASASIPESTQWALAQRAERCFKHPGCQWEGGLEGGWCATAGGVWFTGGLLEQFSLFFEGCCDGLLHIPFKIILRGFWGPRCSKMEAEIEAKTLPKRSKFRTGWSMPKMIEISFKIASFFDVVFDEMLSGFQVVFLASWQKRMFKKCTKTQCFCTFFEDQPFWLQHHILFKCQWKWAEIKFFFLAWFGHGFLFVFWLILGSLWGPKSIQNEVRKRLGNLIGNKRVQDRSKTPQGLHVGANLGPKRGPKRVQNSLKKRS